MITPLRASAALAALGIACSNATAAAAANGTAADGSTRCELPRSSAAAEGIPAEAIDSLLREAAAARSDAVVLLKDGRIVGEWFFDAEPGPIQTMSVTKSIVSIAIGRLLATGALTSVDQPVSDFFPEWRQGAKRGITIRMLLAHTSGLQNVGNAGQEIYPSPDAVALALAAELSHEPGVFFSYNNKAVNLLGGIIEKAAGMPLDEYMHAEIFEPLCIERRFWYRDEAGNAHAMAGVELTPLELARIGQLMLNGGTWNGRRLLDEAWVSESTRTPQPVQPRAALLWWRLTEPAADDDGVAAERLRGFRGEGFLGQHLVVLPNERIVAVRMKRSSPDHEPAHNFSTFPATVLRLFGEGSAPVMTAQPAAGRLPTAGITTRAARPEDVASIDAIIAAFYDVISRPAGVAPDWARDSTLFLSGVRLKTARAAAGGASIRVQDHGSYAAASADVSQGFFEREIHRVTQRFGPIARVFSTYEWRRTPDGPVGGRGINSLELFFDGTRWWIGSALWFEADADNPIPPEYLPRS
jgi:CubicO group peptidase (beta-lactamase class C family)